MLNSEPSIAGEATGDPAVFSPNLENGQAVFNANEIWEVDYSRLRKRLLGIPTQVEPILRLLDGRRTLAEVIGDVHVPEELALRVLYRLKKEKVLVPSTTVDAAMMNPEDSIWHTPTEIPTRTSTDSTPFQNTSAGRPVLRREALCNDTLVEDTLNILEKEIETKSSVIGQSLAFDDQRTGRGKAAFNRAVPEEKTTILGKPTSKTIYQMIVGRGKENGDGRGLTRLPELQQRDQANESLLVSWDETPGSFCLGSEPDGLAVGSSLFETSQTVLARRSAAQKVVESKLNRREKNAPCHDEGWFPPDDLKVVAQPHQDRYELGGLDKWVSGAGPKLLSLGPTARRILKREGKGLLRAAEEREKVVDCAGTPVCRKTPRRRSASIEASPGGHLNGAFGQASMAFGLRTIGKLAVYLTVGSLGGYGIVRALVLLM